MLNHSTFLLSQANALPPALQFPICSGGAAHGGFGNPARYLSADAQCVAAKQWIGLKDEGTCLFLIGAELALVLSCAFMTGLES